MITAWIMQHWKPLAIIVVTAVVVGGGVHLWRGRVITKLTAAQQALKADNQRITDEYWQAIGERNALRVQAQAAKVEADAYREQGAQHGTNVAALDAKINTVRSQYDEIQNSLGDCTDIADCRAKLCAKYQAAGIRLTNCPD